MKDKGPLGSCLAEMASCNRHYQRNEKLDLTRSKIWCGIQ